MRYICAGTAMLKNLILYCFVLTIVIGCTSSTLVESRNYSSSAKRINVLKRYFKTRSDILDTVFKIYDVNMNTRSIPGPTDRDYQIILKIDPKEIDTWHEPQSVTSFPFEYDWAFALLKETGHNDFDLSGSKIFYSSENKKMIIFQDTGVIFIRIEQH